MHLKVALWISAFLSMNKATNYGVGSRRKKNMRICAERIILIEMFGKEGKKDEGVMGWSLLICYWKYTGYPRCEYDASAWNRHSLASNTRRQGGSLEEMQVYLCCVSPPRPPHLLVQWLFSYGNVFNLNQSAKKTQQKHQTKLLIEKRRKN